MFNDHSAPKAPIFSHALRDAAQVLRNATHRFGRSILSGVQSVQVARMTGVLASMTDTQLAEVGIARKDIPQYAASLVKTPAAES